MMVAIGSARFFSTFFKLLTDVCKSQKLVILWLKKKYSNLLLKCSAIFFRNIVIEVVCASRTKQLMNWCTKMISNWIVTNKLARHLTATESDTIAKMWYIAVDWLSKIQLASAIYIASTKYRYRLLKNHQATPNTMNWQTHKKQLLKKPEFRKALKETEPELQIAKAVIEARLKRGMTQATLAHRLNTKQSVISRVENAKTATSLTFLKRLARELQTSFEIRVNP